MKWIKKGKIFDPTQFKMSNDCIEFAQSPQALVFDEFVRIYFSTRKKDPENGMYLSFIAYVDIDKDFNKIINVSNKTVIELGKLGTFDEHGIFPFSPLKHNNKIIAYTCGWSRRISVPVETSVGLAYSYDNGETFIRAGDGPILTSSLKEPVLVGDAFVQVYGDVYHMWYIFGTEWIKCNGPEPPARVYKIAHAASSDGINWNKQEGKQIISDTLNEHECQALPTVTRIGERYHMYFCFREATDFRKNSKRGYRLGYAYSDDLINWTRDDHNSGLDVTAGDWDSDMMCYPHIFQCDNKVYLLYNGNEFGKYGFGLAVLDENKFISQEMPMSITSITYKTKTASEQDLLNHLSECRKSYTQHLSKEVDLISYSRKIAKNAITFEAWSGNKLAGLLAIYLNNSEHGFGYITNISVLLEFAGKGIASELMFQCFNYAMKKNFYEIQLRVNEPNIRAINFYKKHNFIQIDKEDDKVIMQWKNSVRK